MLTPDTIRAHAESLRETAIHIRRHLHQHPELSFHEKETAAFVSRRLSELGIPHKTGIGGHGILAFIEGAGDGADRAAATATAEGASTSSGSARPCIALRADMDALPITEENEVEYRSVNDGVMHACGHDSHTTSLLVAGEILNANREELTGTVKLIFQPAEETAPGGAIGMIEEGVLDDPGVDRVFGQHVNTEIPVGLVGFNPGLFMASADEIYVTVRGKGGHAAKPHQGVDPVAVASQIVVALQQVVSRQSDPVMPSVVTFGRIIGNGSANVIPDAVSLDGTLRTLDARWREEALQRIGRVVRGVAEALGAEAEVRIVRGYPPVVNDPETVAIARSAAERYLGSEKVVDLPPAMWAEDFAYFGRERPGCFYNLGVRNDAAGITGAVHTSRFNLDEEALVIGSGLMAWIAASALERTA